MTVDASTLQDSSARALGAARLFAAGPSAGYVAHVRTYGEIPRFGGRLTFLPELEASGLTGRGGSAFSVWRKFAAVQEARGPARYARHSGHPVLIANGAEGEPLSFKDATLLHNAPHLVIDGLLAAAQLLGAKTLVICAAAANLDPVATALAERADSAKIVLLEAPERFVAGQASAVVNLLETGRALPKDLREPLAKHGYKGQPTLVHNVETWAHIALIARYGADWFRQVGTAEDPGTRLVTITGDVPAEVVLEVPGGLLLDDVLAYAGVRLDAVAAVLVGGYHGHWVRPRGLLLGVGGSGGGSGAGSGGGSGAGFVGGPVEESIQGEGFVDAGAGVLHILGPGRCGLAATASMVAYLAAQSARQCGPCMFGLPALAVVLNQLVAGVGGEELLREVTRLSALVAGRGACHHPDGTVQLVRSALETFSQDVRWHLTSHCLETGARL